MADQTVNKVYRTEERGKKAFNVTNAVQIYGGMLVGLSAAGGRLQLWDNVATTIFVGLAEEDALGNTSATPEVRCRVDTSGKVLKGVAVASATQASVGDVVYSQDSNVASLTTVAATSRAIGIIIGYRSASDCDVQLFTPTEFAAYVT